MRQLVIKLLKDGSGRACIHWLRRIPDGPVETASGGVMTAMGYLSIGGVRGQIACNPDQNTVAAQVLNGEHYLCCHSDDPRAITCPACMATSEYVAAMAGLKETLDASPR